MDSHLDRSLALDALDMALKSADDIVVLKEGRPAAAGRPDDVLDEGLLSAVFGTPMRLREVDGRVIGKGSRGPITERLQGLFFDVVHGRHEAHPDWLTLV